MRDEDEREMILVNAALNNLYRTNPAWFKNLNVFYDLAPMRRVWWWRRAKKQADLGVPSMRTLVAEVIKLRMTT